MSRRRRTRTGFDALADMPCSAGVDVDVFESPPRRGTTCAKRADAYVRRLKGAPRSYGAAYLARLRGQGGEPAGPAFPGATALARVPQEKRSAIRDALHRRCAVSLPGRWVKS